MDNERTAGLNLQDEFPTREDRDGFLAIQLRRMEADPDRRDWMARLMIRRADKEIVGHCGFHGPPNMIGRTEIGYTVFTKHRGAVVKSLGFQQVGTQIDEVDGLELVYVIENPKR